MWLNERTNPGLNKVGFSRHAKYGNKFQITACRLDIDDDVGGAEELAGSIDIYGGDRKLALLFGMMQITSS